MKINEVIILKESADSFLDSYYEGTSSHPFDNYVRIYNNIASIEISKQSNGVHLSDIQTLNARSGAGTQAMEFLTSLADDHQTPIYLSAKPYSGNPSHINDLETLVRWYMSLGFRITDDLTDDPGDLEGIEEVEMTYFPR